MTQHKRFSWRAVSVMLGFLAALIIPLLGAVGTVHAANEVFTWDGGLANAQFSDSKVTITGSDVLPNPLTLTFVVKGTYRTTFASPTGCQLTAQLEMTVPPTDGERGVLTLSKPPDCPKVGINVTSVDKNPVIHLNVVAPPPGITCGAGHSWDGKFCTYPLPNGGCNPGDVVLQGTNVCREGGGDNGPGPRCAVTGTGEIACPAGLGSGTDNCYVFSPFGPAPHVWKQVGCNSNDFAQAAGKPLTCDPNAKTDSQCEEAIKCTNGCDITKKYIDPAIKAISALVSVGATLAIIWGGIQYASSADNPQKVTIAKRRIAVAVLTLVGFFLFYQFLNYIIPGGI